MDFFLGRKVDWVVYIEEYIVLGLWIFGFDKFYYIGIFIWGSYVGVSYYWSVSVVKFFEVVVDIWIFKIYWKG